MKLTTRLTFVIVLFLLLVAIRAVAMTYFYDPLIHYFKGDFLHTSLPEIDFLSYYFFLFFRYFLNTIVSLAVIYVVFPSLKVLFFSVKFYLVAFVVLSVVLLLLLKFNVTDSYLLTFYIRRFLIHPLFLLILLPAFYYQKLKNK